MLSVDVVNQHSNMINHEIPTFDCNESASEFEIISISDDDDEIIEDRFVAIQPRRRGIRLNRLVTNKLKTRQLNAVNRSKRSIAASTSSEPQRKRARALIPPEIKTNLTQLIRAYPNGILCNNLLVEYEKRYNESFDYSIYDYTSIFQMCADLPQIFKYTKTIVGGYLLFDCSKNIESISEQYLPFHCNEPRAKNAEENYERHSLALPVSQLDWDSLSSLIAPGVVRLGESIPQCFVDDATEEGNLIDICVGEIYDASKFYIYFRKGELDKLMDDLQKFYKSTPTRVIPEVLLNEGLYCVTFLNNTYYRTVIADILPDTPGTVRVFYLDYGTVINVSNENILFLSHSFADVPCQAMRARLSNIYPPIENDPWSQESKIRFKELIDNDQDICAKITKIDRKDKIIELYLADITDETAIFYINEVLVEEGHAEYIGDPRKKRNFDPKYKPIVKYIHLFPTFLEIESGSVLNDHEYQSVIDSGLKIYEYYPHYFSTDGNVEYSEQNTVEPDVVIVETSYTPSVEETQTTNNHLNSPFCDDLLNEINEFIAEGNAVSCDASATINNDNNATSSNMEEIHAKDSSSIVINCNNEQPQEVNMRTFVNKWIEELISKLNSLKMDQKRPVSQDSYLNNNDRNETNSNIEEYRVIPKDLNLINNHGNESNIIDLLLHNDPPLVLDAPNAKEAPHHSSKWNELILPTPKRAPPIRNNQSNFNYQLFVKKLLQELENVVHVMENSVSNINSINYEESDNEFIECDKVSYVNVIKEPIMKVMYIMHEIQHISQKMKHLTINSPVNWN